MFGSTGNRPRRAWRWLTVLAVAASFQALLPGLASAAVMFVTPASQTVGLGTQVGLTVQVSDVLPDGLSAYDFTLRFDPAVLGFARVEDAQNLGAAVGLGATDVGGGVLLSDFSFELVADLLALQSPSFSLFTIYFDAIGVGTSALSIEGLSTFNAQGDPLTYNTVGASVTVTPRVTRLPEPASLALVLLTLLAMARYAGPWRQRR